jgi:hypothetical protein
MSEPNGSHQEDGARAPDQRGRSGPPPGSAGTTPDYRLAGDGVPGNCSGHRPRLDHAGSTLCRLVSCAPEVADVRMLGQEELPDGTTSYSLSIVLPGGRELSVDVHDC